MLSDPLMVELEQVLVQENRREFCDKRKAELKFATFLASPQNSWILECGAKKGHKAK